MLTGEYMATPQALAKAAADFQKIMGVAESPSAADMRAVYTMHSEVMTNTFTTIDKVYGSFDAFVRDGLKLSQAEVTSIRGRLLE